ncbi:MAG: hypothetical protein C4K60_13150 [Ideonella sp. MAG2]|nr:MAG: hypothetical protein C4K60_13150 [Ideonella sp. MAG2]
MSFAEKAFSADLTSTDTFRAGRAHALIGMVATVAGQFSIAERELELAHAGLQGDPYWLSYLHRRWAHWWLSKGTGARQSAQALLHAQQSANYYRHETNLKGADAGLALQLLAVAQARNKQIEEATASMALGCQWIDTALPKSHPHHLRCEAYSILLAPEGVAGRVGMADLLKRSNADALLARDLVTAAQWHQRNAAKPNWQSFPFLN